MFDGNLTKNELLDTFERLDWRIGLLAEKPRAFVRLFQGVGNFRCIAKAAKVHEATVARRLRKIARKISSDNFVAKRARGRNQKSDIRHQTSDVRNQKSDEKGSKEVGK